MAGSHSGTDEHRQVVLSNLALAGSSPSDLQCGSHWPIWMEDRRLYPLQGEDRDSARHNCSGKHSGFLSLAKFLKDDIRRYLDPESPTQRAVLSAVSNYCEYPREKMFIGIDGCSAPNFPLALINVAHGFSKLATGQGSNREEIKAVGRIKDAMLSYPEMVSGEGRFDLALARAFPGRLLCKVGAEAIEAIALDDPPIGIVVKIHDGNWRALWPVCIEVLRQMGYIEEVKPESPLARFVRPEILNARGIVTGQVVAEFELRTV
jgi:L-asparaginase II